MSLAFIKWQSPHNLLPRERCFTFSRDGSCHPQCHGPVGCLDNGLSIMRLDTDLQFPCVGSYTLKTKDERRLLILAVAPETLSSSFHRLNGTDTLIQNNFEELN